MSNHYSHLTPLNDRVIIKPQDKGEQIIGGIIVPDLGRDKASRGTVVAVGPGRVSDHGVKLPMSVKEGDKVMFNAYSSTELKVDNESLVMLRDHEIDCIVK